MNRPIDLADRLLELAELELAMAKELYARAMAATDPAEHIRLSRAYIRSASAVRRTLKQRREIERDHLRTATARAAAEWPDGAGGIH